MNPPQSSKDEDVMADIQKWTDEERELIALGEEPLGPGYRLTAIKAIATDRIRDEIEREERECDMKGMSLEEKWDRISRYALNMSRDRFLTQRDTPPKHARRGEVVAMDCSPLTWTPGGQNWGPPGLYPDINMMKGKG